LGDVGNLISGLTYSPDDVRDKGLLVLRSSNVQNSKITLDDNVYVKSNIKT
jgi:type I restriction enzyme S subunit